MPGWTEIGSKCIAATFILALLSLPGTAFPDAKKPLANVNAKWGKGYHSLTFDFIGKKCKYPEEVVKGKFPQTGAKPEFRFVKDWPVVAMHAKWTASTKGWPEKYRPQAVDLILMYACDAELYEHTFSDMIISSTFLYPPAFVKEAEIPSDHALAESLRGKVAKYQIIAKAGFGASDYKIKTKIRIGLSKDKKTVFYHDTPEFISRHLKKREYFFAGHDAGDKMHLEVRMVCVCSPRLLFRDEAMRRIEENGRYFVQRLYEDLDDAPTLEEIQEFLAQIRKKRGAFRPDSLEKEPKKKQ